MSDPMFNRPGDPANEFSAEVKKILGVVGECYRRAVRGDTRAISDLVHVAYMANEAIELLESKQIEKLSLVLQASPALPANFQDGEGEVRRLLQRFQSLKVTKVRSDRRKPRAERPDPNNPINMAAREVRRIVKKAWNADDENAKRLGRLTRASADSWFDEVGWPNYLAQCGGDLGRDAILGKLFDRALRSQIAALPDAERPPASQSLLPLTSMSSRATKAAIDAAKLERERQKRMAAVRRISKKITSRLRAYVKRAFKDGVVEVKP